jgi:hypothetical protein
LIIQNVLTWNMENGNGEMGEKHNGMEKWRNGMKME